MYISLKITSMKCQLNIHLWKDFEVLPHPNTTTTTTTTTLDSYLLSLTLLFLHTTHFDGHQLQAWEFFFLKFFFLDSVAGALAATS